MKRSLLLLAAISVLSVPASGRSALRRTAARSHSDIFRRQATTLCASACAGDAAAAAGLESCAGTDLICLCTYLAQISGNCLACVAANEEVTLGELQSGCAAATMSAPVDSVTITDDGATTSGGVTQTSSGAVPTTTSGTCDTQCSSASDVSAANGISACDEQDTECVCAASARLSSGCLACVLEDEGISSADYQAACAGVSSSGSTTATNSGIVPPTSSAATRVTSAGNAASSTRSSSSSTRTGSTTASSLTAVSSPSATRANGASVKDVASGGRLGAIVVFLGIVMA
ncbi:hypothetical protein CALCODRAFT_501217 [Calocera cornea HHB12733]|uniref:Extracellular membrane protein CFEM domain-containing protein n=1 Tax=Calocera cornea HHB12733 TaxID=1353952 RepID=A0A165DRI8_9BASI|nr:hypothetical protein CALCODRAFT_501217 [Calocera cornea HHB12733]